MKQIATRIQKVSLGVITAIFLASFFTSLIPTQSVFAVPADDSSKNPDDWQPSTRAKRWAYLTGLYSCQEEAWDGANEWEDGWDNDKIDESNAKDGKWFYDPPVPKLGRPSEPASFMGVKLKDGEKGVADCNDIVNATADAYSLSPIQLLCKMGGERDDDSPCETSGSGERFNPPDSGDRMDQTEFWGSKSLPENAGATAYYALNLAALMSSEGCNLKEESGASGSFAYELKVVSTTGDITTETYSGQKRDFKVKVYSSYPGLNDQERPCSELASDLEKYAGPYAEWVRNHQESAENEDRDGDGEAETTSCAIDGIGWIICPVMVFIGRMNDAAFVFLEGVLGIRPAIITSPSTQNAWAAFRDIANVMFVIAFLVIVYSQITSAGISNYGIKKMLPRIVVAAILVNASFIICALAVDLSNIVGSSIYSLLKDSIAADIGSEITTTAWEESMGSILAAAATALGVILLVVALFMAPTVLLAFALIILILIARQALVILLIVVAPLAFVAYLLPNTEDWFKKWQKAFTVTLMVYPIVGLVFGASTLASQVLVDVAQGGDEDEQLLMLIALGVLAVPLFAVPAILKGSLSAAGSIGTKIAGLANKADGVAKRQGKRRFDNSIAGQYKNYRTNENNRRRAMMQAGVYNDSGKKGSAFNPRNIRTKMAGAVVSRSGRFGDSLQSKGADIDDKMWDETVGNQQKFMSNEQSLNPTELRKIVDNVNGKESIERRAAAAGLIMKNGGMSDIHSLVNSVQGMGSEASGIRKQMMGDMNRTPFGMGAGDIAAMKLGQQMTDPATGDTKDYNKMLNDRAEKKLSGGVWAGLDPDDQSALAGLAASGGLSDKAMQNLVNATYEAETNDNIDVKDEAKTHGAAIRQQAQQRGIAPTAVASASPQPSVTPASSPAYTPDQIRTMGAANTQRAVDSNGGVEAMHESDLVAIRNAHGPEPIGQSARDELIRRGTIQPPAPRNLP